MIDLSTLNPEQLEAVTTTESKVLTIAPAGSGKTRVLTYRVARLLIEGANPSRMLVTTFTKSAAAEMRERIAELAPGKYLPDIRTVHSFCAQMLRKYPEKIGRNPNFSIYDEKDREDLIRAVGQDLEEVDKPWTCFLKTLERRPRVMEEYRRRLEQANAVDYDQLEEFALKLLQEDEEVQGDVAEHYTHIMVDEFQDTNIAQMALFTTLRPVNFFVVGDPRQSIYRFRGASIEIILDAAKADDWTEIQLTANYRSTPEIVDLANHIAAPMPGSMEPMVATRDSGKPVRREIPAPSEPSALALRISRDISHRKIAPGGIAVLARNWATLKPLKVYLEGLDIPYRYMGSDDDPWSKLDARMLARAVLFLINPSDLNYARWLDGWGVDRPRCGDHRMVKIEVFQNRISPVQAMAMKDPTGTWGRFAELRALVKPRQKMTIQRIFSWLLEIFEPDQEAIRKARDVVPDDVTSAVEFRRWWTFRGVQERMQEDPETDRVTLTTVHGAKGLEWPVVYMASCIDGFYPTDRKRADDDDKEEDRRVLYTAVTRARDRLVVSTPHEVPSWGALMKPSKPSPFLDGFEFASEGTAPEKAPTPLRVVQDEESDVPW